MLEYKGYRGTVEPDHGTFFGRVLGLRDLITFEGETCAEVEQAFQDSIDDYFTFCAERGDQPDRTFGGKIPLRVPPELHRRAAASAQAEGLSVNQWLPSVLSRRYDQTTITHTVTESLRIPTALEHRRTTLRQPTPEPARRVQ